MSIIIALLIFSAIVLFHEFGHFLMAKFSHVTVVEFSLGMGPRLLSFHSGKTRYSLKALPFGGSCQMLGEDLEDISEGTFASRPAWQRILVIAGGPVFNFILAWILAAILMMCIGYDEPIILSVSEGYAAAEAGMQSGDKVISIDGKRIYFFREISDYVRFSQDRMSDDKPIHIIWEHEGETKEADILPTANDYGKYVFGVSGSEYYRTSANIMTAACYGAAEVRYWINLTFLSLKMLLHGDVGVNDMSGPVGVVDAISDTYEESRSDGIYYIFLNMLNIAILLSANLGVMNLLPIPALDGGRLFFLIIELVLRRRVNPKFEGRIHMIGMLLLLLLMVFVMANDIRKLIFGF